MGGQFGHRHQAGKWWSLGGLWAIMGECFESLLANQVDGEINPPVHLKMSLRCSGQTREVQCCSCWIICNPNIANNDDHSPVWKKSRLIRNTSMKFYDQLWLNKSSNYRQLAARLVLVDATYITLVLSNSCQIMFLDSCIYLCFYSLSCLFVALRHNNIISVWEELAFDDAVSYTQLGNALQHS